MLLALILALAPPGAPTVLADQIVTVRPGQSVALALARAVEPGERVQASIQALPGSTAGGLVENRSPHVTSPQEWNVTVLTEVDIGLMPYARRHAWGSLLGGLGLHAGNPPRPTLAAFDGEADFQGPSACAYAYNMAMFAPFEGVMFSHAGALLAQSHAETVFVDCWQRWDLYSSPYWMGHAYPAWETINGGLRVRIVVTVD